MRLDDARTLHGLALYLLPVLVAGAGWGVGAASAMALGMAILGIYLRLRPVVAGTATRPRLHTISYSHYVEKVRWCLSRAGVDYEELPSVGVLGVLLLGRTVPTLELPAARTSIGNSAEILRFLWGRDGLDATGRVAFLRPTAEAVELERHLDQALGEQVRRWVYFRVFEDPELTLRVWGHGEPKVPRWQRALLPLLRPLLRAAVRRMLHVTPTTAVRALERTQRVFDEMDARLADGRRYLMGDTLSYVDIVFASLGALAVLPDDYGGGALTTRFPAPDALPAAWRDEVLAFRQRPSGQFILRMYRDERRPPAA